MNRFRLRLVLPVAALAMLASGAAEAQDSDDDSSEVPVVSQPVVQAIPAREGMSLNDALGRLARNPRDVEALIDAGKAALAMGDADAAIGFFQRADQVSPGNARVKAGLAGAYVRSEDPFTAIALFDQAAAAGASDPAFYADRALAYDLVGDGETAQTYYRQALDHGADDDTIRRYALSLAISQNRRAMEEVLSPLLQRQDKAAWRIRAFSLAILGKSDEAEAIAASTMPAEMATALGPYFRYMPRLTPAQQAAAANFGHFPRAADIGHDDPRIAAFARPVPRATLAVADGAAPATRQSNQRSDRSSRRDSRGASGNRREAAVPSAAAAPPPVPQPTRVETATEPVRTAVAAPSPRAAPAAAAATVPTPAAPVSTAPSPAATVVPAAGALPVPPPSTAASASVQTPVPTSAPPAQVAVQTVPTAPPAAAPPPSTPAPGFATLGQPVAAAEGFDLANVTTPAANPPPAAAPATPLVQSRPRPSLASVFADLAAPPPPAQIAPGAVDMAALAANRAATQRAAPPRAASAGQVVRTDTSARGTAQTPARPSHPSRIWVQLATGRDKAALGFDWRRMARQAETAFRSRQPSVSAWGQSNRLLAGPFESEAAANAFITQLRRADITGLFVWTSPAGQVVDALPLR